MQTPCLLSVDEPYRLESHDERLDGYAPSLLEYAQRAQSDSAAVFFQVRHERIGGREEGACEAMRLSLDCTCLARASWRGTARVKS